MKLWIDTDTGTWGNVDGLRVIDLDDNGPGPDHVIGLLDTMGDSEVSEYGRAYGKPVAL